VEAQVVQEARERVLVKEQVQVQAPAPQQDRLKRRVLRTLRECRRRPEALRRPIVRTQPRRPFRDPIPRINRLRAAARTPRPLPRTRLLEVRPATRLAQQCREHPARRADRLPIRELPTPALPPTTVRPVRALEAVRILARRAHLAHPPAAARLNKRLAQN